MMSDLKPYIMVHFHRRNNCSDVVAKFEKEVIKYIRNIDEAHRWKINYSLETDSDASVKGWVTIKIKIFDNIYHEVYSNVMENDLTICAVINTWYKNPKSIILSHVTTDYATYYDTLEEVLQEYPDSEALTKYIAWQTQFKPMCNKHSLFSVWSYGSFTRAYFCENVLCDSKKEENEMKRNDQVEVTMRYCARPSVLTTYNSDWHTMARRLHTDLSTRTTVKHDITYEQDRTADYPAFEFRYNGVVKYFNVCDHTIDTYDQISDCFTKIIDEMLEPKTVDVEIVYNIPKCIFFDIKRGDPIHGFIFSMYSKICADERINNVTYKEAPLGLPQGYPVIKIGKYTIDLGDNVFRGAKGVYSVIDEVLDKAIEEKE